MRRPPCVIRTCMIAIVAFVALTFAASVTPAGAASRASAKPDGLDRAQRGASKAREVGRNKRRRTTRNTARKRQPLKRTPPRAKQQKQPAPSPAAPAPVAASPVTAEPQTSVAAASAPVAAATPAPARKKGVGTTGYIWSNPGKITALGLDWAYGWSPRAPASTQGIDFVPMVWGQKDLSDSTLSGLKQGREAGRFKALLGFNEPDHTDQSNMTPAEAAAAWPKLEATGLRLGSPAPASPWSPSQLDPSRTWLDDFFARVKARGGRVDFLALHFYPDFTDPNAPLNLKSTLTWLHEKYKMPIWITEIGTIDVRMWGVKTYATPTVERARTFTRETAAMLDSLDFVERYAWFMDSCFSTDWCRMTSLFDGAGALTPVGQAYAGTAAAAPSPAPPTTASHTLVGEQSGKCVDAPNGTTTDWTRMQLWSCWGGDNQRWTRTAAGQLVGVQSGLCLDAEGHGLEPGTKVITYRCSSGDNQKWTVAADGTIRGVESGLCLDAYGQGTADGTPLVLWTCNGGPNQRWALR